MKFYVRFCSQCTYKFIVGCGDLYINTSPWKRPPCVLFVVPTASYSEVGIPGKTSFRHYIPDFTLSLSVPICLGIVARFMYIFV